MPRERILGRVEDEVGLNEIINIVEQQGWVEIILQDGAPYEERIFVMHMWSARGSALSIYVGADKIGWFVLDGKTRRRKITRLRKLLEKAYDMVEERMAMRALKEQNKAQIIAWFEEQFGLRPHDIFGYDPAWWVVKVFCGGSAVSMEVVIEDGRIAIKSVNIRKERPDTRFVRTAINEVVRNVMR